MLESVPDIAVEVIISAEQKAAALGERHRRDATDDVVVRVHSDLLVGTDVEQPARGVVRTGRERKPARKELHRNNRYARYLLAINITNYSHDNI